MRWWLLLLMVLFLCTGAGWPAVNSDIPVGRAAIGLNTFSPVADHAASTDGVTDAASAINASIADCVTAGGGIVDLGPYRYAVVADDIRISTGCTLRAAYVPFNTTTADFTQAKGALVVDPARSVRVCLGGKLSNVQIYQRGLVPATDKRSSISLIASFAGTLVKATLCGTQRADYADIRDVQILGGAIGLDVGANHPVLSNIWIDATQCLHMGPGAESGTLGSKDFTTINNVECYPYLTYTAGAGPADPRTKVATITAVADNGSGKPRITVDTTAALVTGDTSVWPASVGGFTGVNTRCDVIVIDMTHFECGNIQTAPTSAATLNTGSKVVKLPAFNAGGHARRRHYRAGLRHRRGVGIAQQRRDRQLDHRHADFYQRPLHIGRRCLSRQLVSLGHRVRVRADGLPVLRQLLCLEPQDRV
jgi:hypothetical protein